MVNSDAFAKRLQKVIDYYGESASSFAEKIQVQRSSISHVISGRNKPSLEFVLKVVSSYPEVELYWLLNGKGDFPTTGITDNELSITSDKKTSKATTEPVIERIVVFYSDGTFKSYRN